MEPLGAAPDRDSQNSSGRWLHGRRDALHDGDGAATAGFHYSRDSSYLRLKQLSAGAEVHFPNGQVQTFDALGRLPGVTAFPTAANFALLELDRPAAPVAAELLAAHGVYVRNCADKRGLEGGRFLRVAARSETENARIAAALRAGLRQARTACDFSTLAIEGG